MARKKTETAPEAVETKAEEAAAAPAEEKAPAKKPAAKKAAATETVYVQFGGVQADVSALVAAAKAAFKEEKPRTAIKDLKLYVKPEEATAYYVVNDSFEGKVSF